MPPSAPLPPKKAKTRYEDTRLKRSQQRLNFPCYMPSGGNLGTNTGRESLTDGRLKCSCAKAYSFALCRDLTQEDSWLHDNGVPYGMPAQRQPIQGSILTSAREGCAAATVLETALGGGGGGGGGGSEVGEEAAEN